MTVERASLSIELLSAEAKEPPKEFRLFKLGKNRTLKGDLVYSERSAEEVAQFQAELDRDVVIDWEHASLKASEAVDPAEAGKAAGWFRVEPREDGLWATNVSWTEKAAAKLAAREFRYFSPVVFFDPKSKEITAVFNAALTGNPATMAQEPLVASITTPEEEPTMKLIAAALSMPVEATEAQLSSAVEKLKEDKALLLAATGKATVAEASGAINAWKEGAAKAEALSAELDALKAKATEAEVLSTIEAAKKEGKVAPAQVELLKKMGTRSLDELRAFLAAAPKVLPAQKSEPTSETSVVLSGLSEVEKKIIELTGVSAEEFAKAKAKGPVVAVEATKPAMNAE